MYEKERNDQIFFVNIGGSVVASVLHETFPGHKWIALFSFLS